jgi:hypothetical protein
MRRPDQHVPFVFDHKEIAELATFTCNMDVSMDGAIRLAWNGKEGGGRDFE